MSKLLVVLPVLSRETADKCIESVLMNNSAAGFDEEDLLIVDNTKEGLGDLLGLKTYRDPDGHNLGVPRSWNVGARALLKSDKEYLVLLSASMLFGPMLHTTFVRQMEAFWGSDVIECDGHSWHLIAFHRRVFEKIGLFDENFYPGYFEAIDFGYRMRLNGMEGGWPRVWVNALSQGDALHIDHGTASDHLQVTEAVHNPATPLLDYYRLKWGGDKGEERYILPFNGYEIGYFPAKTIPQLAEEYKLEKWW